MSKILQAQHRALSLRSLGASVLLTVFMAGCNIQTQSDTEETAQPEQNVTVSFQETITKVYDGVSKTFAGLMELTRATVETAVEMTSAGARVIGRLDEVGKKVDEGMVTIRRGVEAVKSVQAFLSSFQKDIDEEENSSAAKKGNN